MPSCFWAAVLCCQERSKGPCGPAPRGHPFTFWFWAPEGRELLLSSVQGPRLPSPSPCPPPVTISTAGSTPPLASFVPEGREELDAPRPPLPSPPVPARGACGPPELGWGDLPSPAPRAPAARALLGSSLGEAGGRGAIGSFWPLPSEGVQDLAFVRAAAVQCLCRREKSLSCRLLTLPVCNIHYPDDCVFSLITHYFYAERGFLTKGKTTAITFISLEQLTHT